MSSLLPGAGGEQLQAQVAILNASLQRTEDVLKRFESVVAATTTGIVVLDQTDRIAILLNADCAPLLEFGQPLPQELGQALTAAPAGSALDCEHFEIVEVTRDDDGNLLGFAFFPKEAVDLTPDETPAAPATAPTGDSDMLAGLLGDDEDEELADILTEMEKKELPQDPY